MATTDDILQAYQRDILGRTLSIESVFNQFRGYANQQFAYIQENMLTKDEFRAAMTQVASKDDLLSFATKDDLADFATKDDLAHFATKDDLLVFATKKDLLGFATKDDLVNFATKDDLERFATKDDLANFATAYDLANVAKVTEYSPSVHGSVPLTVTVFTSTSSPLISMGSVPFSNSFIIHPPQLI